MKLARIGLIALLTWLPGIALAAAFEEGKEYQELPFAQPIDAGGKIEVREFFWYGCPHCYTLEPVLERWLKKLPANVAFERTPGAAPRWLVHAQAFYTFQALGVLDRLHGPFFDAVQSGKRKLDNEAAIAEFAKQHGIDPAKFQEAFNSFGVRLEVEKAKRLNEAYNINAVPTFVVNGRYVTSPAMAGGEQAVLKVLDYLIQKAGSERARKAGKR